MEALLLKAKGLAHHQIAHGVWITHIVTRSGSGHRSTGRGKEKAVHFSGEMKDSLAEKRSVRHAYIIASPVKPTHEPIERPTPMSHWQIDGSHVPSDPDGKRQHVVETLNIIDTGTSIQLDAHVRSDFTVETPLEALAMTLAKYGLPKRIATPVGSAGSDFPAALLRFGACLGIEIEVCEAHHPQQNDLVAYCTPSVR